VSLNPEESIQQEALEPLPTLALFQRLDRVLGESFDQEPVPDRPLVAQFVAFAHLLLKHAAAVNRGARSDEEALAESVRIAESARAVLDTLLEASRSSARAYTVLAAALFQLSVIVCAEERADLAAEARRLN
jgi:hypothetical protein